MTLAYSVVTVFAQFLFAAVFQLPLPAAHHTHLFPHVLASNSNGLDTMRSAVWISLPSHHCSSQYTHHCRGMIQTEGQKVAQEEKRALFWSWDVGRM